MDKILHIFARQSGDQMACGADISLRQSVDCGFDGIEIVSAPDNFAGAVIGGLNAELDP